MSANKLVKSHRRAVKLTESFVRIEVRMRYVGAAILICLGTCLLLASVIAGAGVHLPGDARIGIPLALLGIGTYLGAYRIVRDLPGETGFRIIISFIPLWGSLALPTALIRLGFQKITMSPREVAGQYETVSYAYMISFGVTCICALVLLNRLFKARSAK